MLTTFGPHFRQVFFTKLAFNIKSEVSKTYLGYLWWLLEPALYVAVMYVVFGILLRTRTENFMLFLICGQVPFTWFSRSVGNSSQSILRGRGLINQVAIHKAFFPLLTVSQDLVKQCVVFTVMLAVLYGAGEPIVVQWLAMLPLVVVQFTLIAALAMCAAAIVPVIPDFRFLITTGLMMMMWGSGIFYSYEQVLLPQHRSLFLMNPMANLIKNYRQVLLDGQWPDWQALGLILLFSLMVIAVMFRLFRRFDTTYARLVAQ